MVVDAIEVTATEFAYDPAEISVTAGETFTIQLTDAGAIEHDLDIRRRRRRREDQGRRDRQR